MLSKTHLRLTKFILVIETLSPFFLRLISIAAFYLGITWLGLFNILPLWGHFIALVTLLMGLLWALYPLKNLKIPQLKTILSRLDNESGINHSPLTTLNDTPVGDNKESVALYEAHKARIKAKLHIISYGYPRLNWHYYDPFALRTLVALIFTCGFFTGTNSLYTTFEFNKSSIALWRSAIWVTPPDYTGLPSTLIFSDQSDSTTIKIMLPQIEMVKGSKLLTRTEGLPNFKPPFQEMVLNKSIEFTLTGIPKRQNLAFKINALNDRAPTIAFIDPPKIDDKARLVLAYKIDDDFGAKEVLLHFEHTKEVKERLTSHPRPLTFLEAKPLTLPPSGKGDSITLQDFGDHPFAGLPFEIWLSVKDELGQQGETPRVTVTLPRRPFVKPLALALLEQRQNLALDMRLKPKVLQALEAMMIAPQIFTPETAVYLGLRTNRARLLRARSETRFHSVTNYLYEMALFIEEGYGSEAEKQFKALQEELRKAMERNAPADEIAELMKKIREAMAKMMAEIAKNLKDKPKAESSPPPNSQQFNAKNMNDILKEIEELMRQGAFDQARKLMQELQEMMAQMMEAMKNGELSLNEGEGEANELSEMMKKQQELRDKTFNENRNGKKSEEDLAGDQEALRKKLEELKGKGEQNGEAKEGLDQAEREMGNARDALKKGDTKGAMEAQRNALQGLQKGAQAQKPSEGEGQSTAGNPNGERGTDPLGRPRANDTKEGKNNESATGNKGAANALSGGTAGERAGKILDELRKRAGEISRSQTERDYIDRLLKGLK